MRKYYVSLELIISYSSKYFRFFFFSACKLNLECVRRTAARATCVWCLKALYVSSELGCSRHSWFSCQLSLGKIFSGRQLFERHLDKQMHTNPSDWYWRVTVARRIHQHSRDQGFNWGQFLEVWQKSDWKQAQMVLSPPLSLMAHWSDQQSGLGAPPVWLRSA